MQSAETSRSAKGTKCDLCFGQVESETSSTKLVKPVQVFHFDTNTTEELQLLEDIFGKNAGHRHPVIIKGCDIGPCRSKWSVDYLKNVSPSKLVKVHRSNTSQLDFIDKNFKYETVTFSELIDYCSKDQHQHTQSQQARDSEGESANVSEDNSFYYLRSLGEDPRGRDTSNLSKHFPDLYKDLRIPQLYQETTFFSSVFRITSPLLQLWTHYDTCDNILIQVKGTKRIVFFPPWSALNLYLEGDKSAVIDIDNPSLELHPDFVKAERFECVLNEGDILFIPSLWFHNVTALNFSISVNVFWKNLENELYGKDTYGNRDLTVAELGFRTLDKAVRQLKVLPIEYQDFYLRRMIISLQKKLGSIKLDSDS